jgi:hypothetical protein
MLWEWRRRRNDLARRQRTCHLSHPRLLERYSIEL